MARDLLREWPEVASRLRAVRRVVLFLDFDGTLTPLRSRPEEATLGVGARQALRDLVRCPRVRVWVISGRRRADVRRLTGVRGIDYLGLYGWEGAEGRARLPRRALKLLRQVKRAFQASIAGVAGAWVEHKEPLFALHYRQASVGDARHLRAMAVKLVRESEPELRLLAGKKVLEVLPHEIRGKAETVRKILADCGAGTLAIYAGDDTADEEVFRVLGDAITVRVGSSRSTNARFRLRNPATLLRFLRRLRQEVSPGPDWE